MNEQISMFDWMKELDQGSDEEPEVGEWVYKREAPIPPVMRRSYIGKKVLMDKSTQSQECYKVGILEDVINGRYWNGKEYKECEISIVFDGSKCRNQINHTLFGDIYECLPRERSRNE